MGTLLLIRHGQASYGQADYDRLSERGVTQARALGEYLARQRLTSVLVGPHRRQQQTIDYARQAGGDAIPAPVATTELAEYPAFELLKHLLPRLVAEDPKFVQLQTAPTPKLYDEAFHAIMGRWGRDEWQIAGVERVTEFVARVRAAIDRAIAGAQSGARIAMVTSAGPIGVAVGLVFGIAPERMVRTSVVVRNTSITELRFRSGAFAWQPDQLSLVAFNGTAHLSDDLNTDR